MMATSTEFFVIVFVISNHLSSRQSKRNLQKGYEFELTLLQMYARYPIRSPLTSH